MAFENHPEAPDADAEVSAATPPSALIAIIRSIDGFSKWIGSIVCLLILPLMAVVIGEVGNRFFTGRSLFWAYDSIYMIYGTFFMLGVAYTLSVGGHIRSDFLYISFPIRIQGLINSIAYLFFFFPTIIVLGWFGFENAYEAWLRGERAITSAWMPVLYPFKAVIPITAVLLVIQGVSELAKSLYALIAGRRI